MKITDAARLEIAAGNCGDFPFRRLSHADNENRPAAEILLRRAVGFDLGSVPKVEKDLSDGLRGPILDLCQFLRAQHVAPTVPGLVP